MSVHVLFNASYDCCAIAVIVIGNALVLSFLSVPEDESDSSGSSVEIVNSVVEAPSGGAGIVGSVGVPTIGT
jgi:hypothetical protein